MGYYIRPTMGNTIFEVIDSLYDRRIETFYTEEAAKEFCDKLKIYEYFKTRKINNDE